MREIRSDIEASAILDLISSDSDSEDATNIAFYTRIIDASPRGLKVESPIEVVVQQSMGIQITIREYHFRLIGYVKWCEQEEYEGFSCGVAIEPTDSPDIDEWRAYLEK